MNQLRINKQRFLEDFAELSRVGATPEGGVNRPTFSDAHLAARAWFKKKTLQAGLQFSTDKAGNHSAHLECGKPEARTLLLGSHLDSVYNGGRFDGALGVMAALEVLRTIKQANIELPFNLEVIDFSDEEGTLVGMLGSKAFTGKFETKMISQGITGKDAVEVALGKSGLQANEIISAYRDPNTLHGYLELHIEQGMHLHQNNIQIGVVTGIVGMGVLRVTFIGTANHAGTTGMNNRRDAGLGASALTLAVRDKFMHDFPGSVVTVGQMTFEPGGVNIVPARAVLSTDFRSVDSVVMERLQATIMTLAEEQAQKYNLDVHIDKTLSHPPAVMSPPYQDAIIQAANTLELTSTRMPSGAGHDAQNMALVCPAGMIFVPSRDGISHSPFEETSDDDCLNGANVLLHSVLNLACKA